MAYLNIQVPPSRDCSALATLKQDGKVLFSSHAAASATPEIAARHGNPKCDALRPWGHPPIGQYQLLTHRKTKRDEVAEYGSHLLAFEPSNGEALQAQAYGRLGLLVYGGQQDVNDRLRRTQGGVRLPDAMLAQIMKRLKIAPDFALYIEYLTPPWWKFWTRTVNTSALSNIAVKAIKPPLDEMTILENLLASASPKRIYGASTSEPDRNERNERNDKRDDSRDSDYSSSSSRSESETFRGGGGQSAGGGASGGWDSAPATARGVDASGRMVAGVAAAAVLGAVAGHALAERDGDSNTRTNTAY